MKHLLICREYPPAPGGGIGTYAQHIARLLAERGETVHVIGRLGGGAGRRLEERCDGRLVIHRVPGVPGRATLPRRLRSSDGERQVPQALRRSSFPAHGFAWEAARLAETIIEREGIEVVEAQDYEAPLYYLQLRRALGLGPRQQPPCIVHLHSLTEFIVLHDDWDIAEPRFRTAKRLEDYSVAAADALLCPSRYYARQVEAHYAMRPDTVEVIPYPVGDTPFVEREPETWARGPVCYMGRLEGRKGFVEWIDAAVAAARRHPVARFDFVGAVHDVGGLTGDEFLDRRIPRDLRPRFRFFGRQDRSSVLAFLRAARIAVVPSRWDNLPYTCLEAMSSGLPVLASPEGGMAEVIEDGRTGWLAGGTGDDDLALALERALATPPLGLAEMGREAAAEIRRVCSNEEVLERHLTWRRRVAEVGARRSLEVPPNLPHSGTPIREHHGPRPHRGSAAGIAVVVTRAEDGRGLDRCLGSLERQTQPPLCVAVVEQGDTPADRPQRPGLSQRAGTVRVLYEPRPGGISPRRAGLEALLRSGAVPRGFVFLEEHDRLQPGFVARCDAVLERCPRVGVVSCWSVQGGASRTPFVRPCPTFPDQWLRNDAVAFSAIRTEAIDRAGGSNRALPAAFELWEMVNAAMAAGWAAVTVPEVLGYHHVADREPADLASTRLRREILSRHGDSLARDAREILILAGSGRTAWQAEDSLTLGDGLALTRILLRDPRRAAAWSWQRMRKHFRRLRVRLHPPESISPGVP